jgi:GGDEF domain-containing protein
VHDNLTGLPNRELFNDRLDAALTFAARTSAPKPTVLVIDIDRFKQINESVGFSAGDSILLTLSRRLGRLLRRRTRSARIAGDQFAIILLSERDPDRIIGFAEMVRRALDDADHLRGARDLPDRLDRPRALRSAERQAARDVSRTPRSPWRMPSARAATASRSSAPPCARTAATA